MSSQVGVGDRAGWRALAAVAALSLGVQAAAGAAARRPSAARTAHRKPAHRAPAAASRHGKAKHPGHPAAHQAGEQAAGSTRIAPMRPPRWHPGLDLAFRMSGKRVPGR